MAPAPSPRPSSGSPRVPPLVKARGILTATFTLSFIILSAAVGARGCVAARCASQRGRNAPLRSRVSPC
jgi:hypothetical protein